MFIRRRYARKTFARRTFFRKQYCNNIIILVALGSPFSKPFLNNILSWALLGRGIEDLDTALISQYTVLRAINGSYSNKRPSNNTPRTNIRLPGKSILMFAHLRFVFYEANDPFVARSHVERVWKIVALEIRLILRLHTEFKYCALHFTDMFSRMMVFG